MLFYWCCNSVARSVLGSGLYQSDVCFSSTEAHIRLRQCSPRAGDERDEFISYVCSVTVIYTDLLQHHVLQKCHGVDVGSFCFWSVDGYLQRLKTGTGHSFQREKSYGSIATLSTAIEGN